MRGGNHAYVHSAGVKFNVHNFVFERWDDEIGWDGDVLLGSEVLGLLYSSLILELRRIGRVIGMMVLKEMGDYMYIYVVITVLRDGVDCLLSFILCLVDFCSAYHVRHFVSTAFGQGIDKRTDYYIY
jgi:hypothetical protein